MLPVLLRLLPDGRAPPDVRAALERWRFELSVDSVEASLFTVWFAELGRLVFEDELGELFAELQPDTDARLARLLAAPDGELARFCDIDRTPVVERCDELVATAFALALARVGGRGAIANASTWGRLHPARFAHTPFGDVPVLQRWFDVRVPSGGGNDTVNLGEYVVSNAHDPFAGRSDPRSGRCTISPIPSAPSTSSPRASRVTCCRHSTGTPPRCGQTASSSRCGPRARRSSATPRGRSCFARAEPRVLGASIRASRLSAIRRDRQELQIVGPDANDPHATTATTPATGHRRGDVLAGRNDLAAASAAGPAAGDRCAGGPSASARADRGQRAGAAVAAAAGVVGAAATPTAVGGDRRHAPEDVGRLEHEHAARAAATTTAITTPQADVRAADPAATTGVDRRAGAQLDASCRDEVDRATARAAAAATTARQTCAAGAARTAATQPRRHRRDLAAPGTSRRAYAIAVAVAPHTARGAEPPTPAARATADAGLTCRRAVGARAPRSGAAVADVDHGAGSDDDVPAGRDHQRPLTERAQPSTIGE